MKLPGLLILTFISAGLTANACDVCGGGNTAHSPFLNPLLSKHFIGISYFHRHYKAYTDEGVTDQYFRSIFISGQVRIGKNLRVNVMLPFQVNNLQSVAGDKKISGFGDLSLGVNYTLLNRSSGNSSHAIFAGGGIKLNTGKYERIGEKGEEENFQLGTGSTDYLLNGGYRFTWRNWMLNAFVSYKYNNSNKDGYRFGDVLTSELTAARKLTAGSFTFSPNLKFTTEQYMHDADKHVLLKYSGGNVFYSGAGIDISSKRITVGVAGRVALQQDLAGGNLRTEPSCTTHISFIL